MVKYIVLYLLTYMFIDNILVSFEEPQLLDFGPVVNAPIAEILEGVSLNIKISVCL